jgi:hypothetical protein
MKMSHEKEQSQSEFMTDQRWQYRGPARLRSSSTLSLQGLSYVLYFLISTCDNTSSTSSSDSIRKFLFKSLF